MAIDGQPSEPFQARNGALVLPPGGRIDAFVDVTAAAGTETPILLHDGKEARPIGKIRVCQRTADPPAPLPRPRRCPPTASRNGSTSRTPPGSIWSLGGPQGDWVPPAELRRDCPARLPRQGAAAPLCWP